jgi:protoporphyrinogen oxidase
MVDSVGVIGAGPAGLTAAYELVKRGVRVEVFEARDSVGGLAASLQLWGQTVDLGPHRFFSSDPRVNRIWLEDVGDRYQMVDRLTRIYYGGRFFDYPLKAGNALRGLGVAEALRCGASYAAAKVTASRFDDSSFEGWVVRRFGRRLFETFFKSYSEKLWGISCSELDADFAAQRIRKLSLLEAVRAAFSKRTAKQHKTLVDQFAYPLGGTGSIYETLAQRIRERGGVVRLGTRVRAVHFADDSQPVVELHTGERRAYTHVISSMPVTDLVARMSPPRAVEEHARQLQFRNTILVYLQVEGSGLFPDQWIYVHAPELRCGRITNFRNWVPALYGASSHTILCMEFWCQDDDPLWKEKPAALIALATHELRQTGLCRERVVLDGHVLRLPKSYPVYRRGYKAHVSAVEAFLARFPRLTVIGRYGSFKYNNQDHSILMGYLAAENIANGARYDLWAVNSDSEYQESSRITATGLEQTR